MDNWITAGATVGLALFAAVQLWLAHDNATRQDRRAEQDRVERRRVARHIFHAEFVRLDALRNRFSSDVLNPIDFSRLLRTIDPDILPSNEAFVLEHAAILGDREATAMMTRFSHLTAANHAAGSLALVWSGLVHEHWTTEEDAQARVVVDAIASAHAELEAVVAAQLQGPTSK